MARVRVTATLHAGAPAQAALVAAFGLGLDIRRFELREPHLHDAFIVLTGAGDAAMSRLLKIAVRDYIAYVRTPGFWLSILLVPVGITVFGGSLGADGADLADAGDRRGRLHRPGLRRRRSPRR